MKFGKLKTTSSEENWFQTEDIYQKHMSVSHQGNGDVVELIHIWSILSKNMFLISNNCVTTAFPLFLPLLQIHENKKICDNQSYKTSVKYSIVNASLYWMHAADI